MVNIGEHAATRLKDPIVAKSMGVMSGNLQIVIVAALVGNIFRPLLALKAPYGFRVGPVVKVDAGEVTLVPLKFAVHGASSLELIRSPGLDLLRSAGCLVPVVRVYLYGRGRFSVVCSRFVVEDGIEEDPDAVRVGSADEINQLLLHSPLRRTASFLVDFVFVVLVVVVFVFSSLFCCL